MIVCTYSTALRLPRSSTTSSTDSVSCRSPFVFFDQRAPVQPPAHIALVEPVQLYNDGLCKRRDGHRFLDSRRNVEHAEFQRPEHRMRPHVPPDFLAVVDAI